jgi:hypothetical protein
MPLNDLDAEERELRELLLNGLAGDAAAYRRGMIQQEGILQQR